VIGPVAVDLLLLSSMIQKLIDPRTGLEAYKRLVFTATFFSGVFQVAFGIFRSLQQNVFSVTKKFITKSPVFFVTKDL